jgi:Leucine-rich repeat (LRR) protein
MIGNNLREIEPFPVDVKVRTLQLADNMLQRIRNDTFSNLQYLVDIDLSGNNITALDPHAFM